MGRTVVKLRVTNSHDQAKAVEGLIPASAVRRIEVEAVVDTGATYVCLLPADIERLGLLYLRDVPIRTANGRTVRRLFGGAHVELNEREVPVPVMENSEATPRLVGFLLLEALDLVVDPVSQQVMGNPAHDGKWVADCF